MRLRANPWKLSFGLILAPVFGGALFGAIGGAIAMVMTLDPYSAFELSEPGIQGLLSMAMLGAIASGVVGIPVGLIVAAIAHVITRRHPLDGAIFGAIAGCIAFTPYGLLSPTDAVFGVLVPPISAGLGWLVVSWSYRDG